MGSMYDAIVVGARCAGSPTAMLLARRGYRVLVADRARFPSDTVSTHVVQPTGVAALARWGLLDRLVGTGCPPIHTYAFDFGPLTISGSPGTEDYPVSYCPRRTILDKLLVDAAAEAGAEIREGVAVDDLLFENERVCGIRGRSGSGAPMEERARVVIGADGWQSLVAGAVKAAPYNEVPTLLAGYYSYWSGLPESDRFEIYIRGNRAFAAAPTHEHLTLIVGGWPYAQFGANKRDVEGTFLAMLARVPEFADRLRHARREERFSGAAQPNYFRKPYGPGWVLVGDAGYLKDSITAQGISDAFLDAERCAAALDQVFTGARAFDDAMAEHQRVRDEHALPMYELTCQVARLEPPPPPMQQLLGAIHGHQEAMNAFVRMNAGTIPPAAFFSSPAVAAAAARQAT